MKPSVYDPKTANGALGRNNRAVDLAYCRAEVSDRLRWAHYSQCSRKAVTEPDADGLRWCRQHSPEVVAEREAETAQREQLATQKWKFGYYHRSVIDVFAEVVRLSTDDLSDEELRRRLAELADRIARLTA